MAPKAPQETLADFQDRLYGGGYSVENRSHAFEYGKAFWAANKISPDDTLHGVPAHTFTNGIEPKHSVRHFEYKEKWFIGIVAWIENPRAINPTKRSQPLLVGLIPFGENAEEAEVQMRMLARAMFGVNDPELDSEDPYPVKK